LNPLAGCAAGAWGGPIGCGVGIVIGGGITLWAILTIPGDTSQDQCKDDDAKPAPNNPPITDVQPRDLCEQFALAEAKAGAGTVIMTGLGDEPRLIAHYGPGPWVKKQHTHRCADGRLLVIHYFHSLSSGANVELKFVR
jgi:hypothetical protein